MPLPVLLCHAGCCTKALASWVSGKHAVAAVVDAKQLVAANHLASRLNLAGFRVAPLACWHCAGLALGYGKGRSCVTEVNSGCGDHINRTGVLTAELTHLLTTTASHT